MINLKLQRRKRLQEHPAMPNPPLRQISQNPRIPPPPSPPSPSSLPRAHQSSSPQLQTLSPWKPASLLQRVLLKQRRTAARLLTAPSSNTEHRRKTCWRSIASRCVATAYFNRRSFSSETRPKRRARRVPGRGWRAGRDTQEIHGETNIPVTWNLLSSVLSSF